MVEGFEEFLVAAFVGGEAQGVDVVEDCLRVFAELVDAVEAAEEEGALLAEAAVDEDGLVVGIATEGEKLVALSGGWRILVVAGNGHELDAAGFAEGAFLLFPGVGVFGVAGTAEADDGAELVAVDEVGEFGGGGLSATIEDAFGDGAEVLETVVRDAEQAADEARDVHRPRLRSGLPLAMRE